MSIIYILVEEDMWVGLVYEDCSASLDDMKSLASRLEDKELSWMQLDDGNYISENSNYQILKKEL